MIVFNRISTAFRGYAQSYRADISDITDPLKIYDEVKESALRIVNNFYINESIKVILCLQVLFYRIIDNEEINQTFYFSSNAELIIAPNQIYIALENAFRKILSGIDNFLRNGSGWSIKSLNVVDLHIGRYLAYRGGCGDIKLPNKLYKKRCLINFDAKDEKCFIYCILAKLFPQSHNVRRTTKYQKFLHKLNTKGLTYPVKISCIENFEKKNNLKINVFAYIDNEIIPLKVNKCCESLCEIDLLLYKRHYFLITNFNRLMHIKRNKNHYCKRCLIGFQRKKTLLKHSEYCDKVVISQKRLFRYKGF